MPRRPLLAGRTADELRVRCGQALAALRERVPPGPVEPDIRDVLHERDHGTAEELLERFRRRREPCLSPAFADAERTTATLRRLTDAPALTTLATRIVEGRFDLLGFRGLSFGDEIDWQLDPVAGGRFPLVHWSRLVRLDRRSPLDRKIVWELNRHGWFVVLGRAYRLTGDERYAEAFARRLNAWIEQNPPRLGVNWSSSLELAFRAISWTWALWLFRASTRLTPGLFLRALRSLHLHAAHIARYPSTYSSPNTHLTGEALGLYYVGTMWPELRSAAAWRRTGLETLLSSLGKQVAPDGVYFERSTAYHRHTIDLYAHLVALADANSDELAPVVHDRLGALLAHLRYVTRPDGTMPLLGDDDGGRLLPLDERAYGDACPTLALGAALLGRPDLKYGAGGPTEELLWLLGPDSIATYDALAARPPADTSRSFPAGGVHVMRDGWTASASVLTLDCGDHAGAHDHAGALGFDLALAGQTLLVDPGTHSYVRGRQRGDSFRSTWAHNTVVVDGQSSSVPAEPFRWQTRARATLRAWQPGPSVDFFEGSHDGYERLSDPVSHVRSVLFVKGKYVVVRDRLEAAGAHRYDLRFHFTPGAQPSLASTRGSTFVQEAALQLVTFGPGSWRLSTEPVSRRYGESEPAPVATWTARAEGAQEFFTFLLPGGAATVRELTAARGRVFEVRVGEELDRLAVAVGEAAGGEAPGRVAARSVAGDWVVEHLGASGAGVS